MIYDFFRHLFDPAHLNNHSNFFNGNSDQRRCSRCRRKRHPYIVRDHDDDDDEDDDDDHENRFCRCPASSVSTAPLHPVQSFHRVCARIEANDEMLTCVDFRDEFLDVRKLAEALAVNSHLKELHMQRTIRDRETKDSRPRSAPAYDVLNLCMEGLRYNTGLLTLDLSQTCIRSSGALFVSCGLRDHPTLQKLRLSRCTLQDEGVRRLGTAPLGRQLQELDLSNNLLVDGASLLQILLMNPKLETLDLSVNDLTPTSLEAFLQQGFLSLKSLNLSRNHLSSDSPSNALGRALGATTGNSGEKNDGGSGDEKTLAHQSQKVHSAVAAAPKPRPPCRLEELRLGLNTLSNVMAESIADGLTTNKSLRKLDLSQNFVGNKGAAALAVAISDNPGCKLRELSLSANKIHDTGALALLLFACSSSSSSKGGNDATPCSAGIKILPVLVSAINHSSAVPATTVAPSPENGLRRLDLSNNRICNGQAISNALQFVGTYNDTPLYAKGVAKDLKQADMPRISSSTLKCIKDWDSKGQPKSLPDPRLPSSLRYFNIHRNPISFKYKQEIRFWTRLNSSGGRRLLSISGNNERGGDALARWPQVLGDVSDDPNSLFFFLVRKPETCSFASSPAIGRPLGFERSAGIDVEKEAVRGAAAVVLPVD